MLYLKVEFRVIKSRIKMYSCCILPLDIFCLVLVFMVGREKAKGNVSFIDL